MVHPPGAPAVGSIDSGVTGGRQVPAPVSVYCMKPVIALVGRPNVGKSTLFNRMTRSRDALVADLPGLTRDRHYGEGRVGERPFIAIDTGGFKSCCKRLRRALGVATDRPQHF